MIELGSFEGIVFLVITRLVGQRPCYTSTKLSSRVNLPAVSAAIP